MKIYRIAQKYSPEYLSIGHDDSHNPYVWIMDKNLKIHAKRSSIDCPFYHTQFAFNIYIRAIYSGRYDPVTKECSFVSKNDRLRELGYNKEKTNEMAKEELKKYFGADIKIISF